MYEGSTLLTAEAALGALNGQLFETGAEDGAPLVAPMGFQASDGVFGDRVYLTWNAVAGATHYQVYRAASLEGARTPLTGWQSAGYYNDRAVVVGTTYYYWAKAAASSSGARASDFSAADAGFASADINGEPRVLRRFGYGDLWCIAYSPDGTMFLAGTSAEDVSLFDLASGSLLQTFTGHTPTVFSVAFSPDGRRVLAGAYKTPNLWDVSTGGLLMSFIGHTDRVNSVAYSPDGTRVLTGSADQTAKVWDVASGNLLKTIGTSLRPVDWGCRQRSRGHGGRHDPDHAGAGHHGSGKLSACARARSFW